MEENTHRIRPDEFKEFENSLNGSGGGSETGQDQETKDLLKQKNRSLAAIEKCAKKFVSMVDGGLKNSGRPGIGSEEFQEDYVDVGMVSLENLAGDAEDRQKLLEFLRKAPGYGFGLLTAGWIVRNVLHELGNKNSNSENSKGAE